jgi:hypothetical protein
MQKLQASDCWLSGQTLQTSRRIELGASEASLHALAYVRLILLEAPNYIEDGDTLCVKVHQNPLHDPVEVTILCERKWHLSPLDPYSTQTGGKS